MLGGCALRQIFGTFIESRAPAAVLLSLTTVFLKEREREREQERLYVEETILGQSHVASAEGIEVLQEVAKIPSLALGDLNLPDE